MNRSGLLIVGAVIVAAAVLVATFWNDLVKAPQTSGGPTSTSPAASGDREAQLVKLMNDVASGGGYAATFQPNDAHKWNLDPGHRLERFRFTDSGVAFARVSSTEPLNAEVVHLGAAVFWPAELSNRFSGKKVEVGVIARQAISNPSPSLAIVFATRQAGNSGWKDFQLSPQFELLKFTYDVPAAEQGYQSEPMVVVHADPQGQGRSVELLGIVVRPAQ
jgi:hypothetical protein